MVQNAEVKEKKKMLPPVGETQVSLFKHVKDLLRAWKVLGRHYLKSGNSLDETHREEISQPVVKN